MSGRSVSSAADTTTLGTGASAGMTSRYRYEGGTDTRALDLYRCRQRQRKEGAHAQVASDLWTARRVGRAGRSGRRRAGARGDLWDGLRRRRWWLDGVHAGPGIALGERVAVRVAQALPRRQLLQAKRHD